MTAQPASGVPQNTNLSVCTHPTRRQRLTQLERETLALVMQGKSNKEIADELGTDEQCIKNRIRAAYKKLGIKTTRELLPIATQTKELLQAAD